MAAQDYASVVQQLYVSYFGRPADYFGLQNFESQLNALNAPTTFSALNAAAQAAPTSALGQLINSFSASTESTNLYGTDTSQIGTSKFVEQIYLHVLNREPDTAGWNFWVNAIESGSLSRANAALAITQGATDNTTPAGLLDKATVANKLTVATNFTADLSTVAEINGYAGDAAAATARGMLATVDSTTNTTAFQATVDSTVATITAGPSVTTNLTAGVDTIVGTAANDVFTGTMTAGNPATTDTLNSLDSIDGGAGNNTLNVLVLDNGHAPSFTGLPSGVSLTNIQNLSIRSAVDIFVTTALTESSVAVTQAISVTELTVGSATAVSVSGVTAGGAIFVDGGTSETIVANGNDVTLGSTTAATGAISLSESNTAGHVIAVDGGSSVSITATGISANTATITVGANTAPTGAVVVNATGVAVAAASATTMGDIAVTGGSTVAVVQNATSDASAVAADTASDTVIEGAVAVTGVKTTSVTVQQTATVAGSAGTTGVAGVHNVETVTFGAIKQGDAVTVDGLTFTAAKDLTATQVASAFAGLTIGADQGSAAASLGVYSGSVAAADVAGVNASGYTSAATVGGTSTAATLVFTASKAVVGTLASPSIVDFTPATTAAPTIASNTTGVLSVTEADGVLGVTAGAVTITSDNKLTTVNLDGYGVATISSNGLTSLSLADSDASVGVTNTVATTLGLTLNNVGSLVGATLDLGATYTSLNITTAVADSVEDINAAGVTALTIAGTNAVDLTGSTFTNLKTVTVTGAAGVTIDASGANVTAVDTSATTGDSAVKIDATLATFTGGAGAETVTVVGAITKAIALGAGNDTLILSNATAPTATVDGGDGTDTITFTDGVFAATATSSSAFESKVTGFEKLGVTTFGADATVDLHNMHDINYVVVGGGTGGTLTFSDMGANGTVELDGADTGTAVAVTLADATGTSDVLNVVLKANDKLAGADTDFGMVKATGVETINLTATDTSTKADTFHHVVDVLDAAVKAIVVTGNANVILAVDTSDVALASVDATALTGTFTATTNGTVAETIKGSAAGNSLTAIGTGDVLIGGAASDTLTVQGDLVKLTGGGGADTFDVSHATTNVNSYATITDLVAGDTIKFTGATSFAASKVVLGDTAVFQDYANAAIAASAAHALSWFQVGGNTYVVESIAAGGAGHTSFDNGTDVIVKITGAVDLSHASLSASTGNLIVH